MIRSPIDIKNSNIWQKANQQSQPIQNLSKRTLIIIGDNKNGKSSFIKLLRADYDLQAKPTHFIDYFVMKKQGVEIQIYEISSLKFIQSLRFLITSENACQLMIVLCIDLTQSQNLVHRINQQLKSIKYMTKQIVSQKNLQNIQAYNEERSRNYQFIQRNEDIEIIDRMPFKFTIIGCKYDLYEKMKLQEKKWISRCLRYLAHTNQANLIFSSTKNLQIAAQLRSIMIDQILGVRNGAYSNQKDFNKAIFILTGEDKISEMSLPAFNNSGAFNQIKILEQQLESVFPSVKNIQPPQNDDDGLKFNCNALDPLIKKNKKEIEQLKRAKNIKTNQMNETNGFQRTNDQFRKNSNVDKNRNSIKTDEPFKLDFSKKPGKKQHYMDQEEAESGDEN